MNQSINDYQLLDFGEGRILEKFAGIILDRPEILATYYSKQNPRLWQQADAVFIENRTDAHLSDWQINNPQIKVPFSWQFRLSDLILQLNLQTKNKNIGLFPEQIVLCDYLANYFESKTPKKTSKILNLFAYTGAVSLVSIAAHQEVVHLDSSRPAITNFVQNLKLSSLDQTPIRYILEDVTVFVKREITRGHVYDAIILDPPKFGRGKKKEIWRVSRDLPRLLDLLPKIFSNDFHLLVLNLYSLEFYEIKKSQRQIEQITSHIRGRINFFDLTLANSSQKFTKSQVLIWQRLF